MIGFANENEKKKTPRKKALEKTKSPMPKQKATAAPKKRGRSAERPAKEKSKKPANEVKKGAVATAAVAAVAAVAPVIESDFSLVEDNEEISGGVCVWINRVNACYACGLDAADKARAVYARGGDEADLADACPVCVWPAIASDAVDQAVHEPAGGAGASANAAPAA